jgi:hypothetical protein
MREQIGAVSNVIAKDGNQIVHKAISNEASGILQEVSKIFQKNHYSLFCRWWFIFNYIRLSRL